MAFRLLLGGLVLLALVLGAELYLREGGLADTAREALVERLGEALGGEVTVESVRLSILPPTLTADGLTLPPKGTGFGGGRVERLQLRLSPWSLLTGGLKSLDIRIQEPHLVFTVPPRAERAAPPGPVAFPDWEQWGFHRVRVRDGRVTVRDGAAEITVTAVGLTGAPDVTLRRYDLALSTGPVAWNATRVLDGASLEVGLEPDRIRVRQAAVEGDPGRLEAAGEVRPAAAEEGEGLYLTLRTTFKGDAAGALGLARRLGAPPLPLAGQVAAEGRLYGTVADLSWDGELSGTDFAWGDDPRRVDALEARVRVGSGQLTVVHAKADAGGGELRGGGDLTLAAPMTYGAQVRADDVSLAWLLTRDLPLGRVSGEARLKGTKGAHPLGTVQWLYRNPGAARPPDDDGERLRERLVARVTEASGLARLEADGAQGHDLTAASPGTRVEAKVTRDPDGALSGTLEARSDDFAELGALFGLDYVHGAAHAKGTLGGTLTDWRVAGRADLMDGRVRTLRVARLVGEGVAEPHRIAFTNVRTGGDGGLRLGGELLLPDPDGGRPELLASVAASAYRVPLWELVGLTTRDDEPLDLDFPVSGHVNLVRGPDGVRAWARIRSGEGSLYGQRVASGEADMWVDHEHLALSDLSMRLPLPQGAAPEAEAAAVVASGALGAAPAPGAEVRADGTLRFADGAYTVTGRTDGLPLAAVDVLAAQAPFLAGTFAGDARLTGDLSDPHLHLEGALRDAAFHGAPVGQGPVAVDLSGWQLRARGELLAPAGREGRARFVYAGVLRSPFSFAVAARVRGTDAVPWVRGLMPEADALAREQLGDDYGLNADGSAAAAGTLEGGPDRVLVKLAGARLTVRGRDAGLAGPARVALADGEVALSGVRLQAEGLDLAVEGGFTPQARYDLRLTGAVGAPWAALVRPDDGYTGGAADLALAVAGPWDAPRVKGAVRLRALEVAPPALQAADAAFTLSGRLAVDGPLADPPAGDVTGVLAPFAVSLSGNRLEAQEVRLAASGGVYRLPGAELAGEMGRLRVEGGWEYARRVGLKAVGSMDLAVLVRQVPGLSQASGLAAVSAEVSGPWEAPTVRAGATLDGGRMRIDAVQQTLDVDTASLLFTDGKVVIDSLEGSLGGGPVTAEGAYDTATREIRMVLTLDAYPFRAIPGLSGVVDGELLLAGRFPAPTLSGDLHVRQALYDRRMQWGSWLMDTVTSGRTEVARNVPLGDTRLAVRIYGDEDIVVDNNLAKLVLDLDLALGGTLQEPGLLGRVDVRQGEVYFRDHTFTVVSASIDFVQPGRIAPDLDVVARTTVDHALPDDPLRTEAIDVDLSLTGPVEKLQLTLTSRPDMPQADLLSLLAVGRTTEELAGAGSGVGASEATYIATGPLQSQLEEQVHRYIGLDQFQVEPFYSDTASTSSSARLTVGKKLFDGKGLVIYSTTLDAAQQPVVQLTYRLSTRTSVLLEQDEEGRAGGEMRFRFRFR